MKIVGRILILLLAAAVVIGATYAFSQTAVARSLPGTLGGRGGFEGRPIFGGNDQNRLPNTGGNNGNFTGRGNRLGGFPGGDFERGGGGLSAVVLMRNFFLIAGVILGVQVLRVGWRKLKPDKAVGKN
jgi:hypothetical protein